MGDVAGVEAHKRSRNKSESDRLLRRRLPPAATRKSNHFYVTNKSDFKGQLAQIVKLVEGGEEEIEVHGLGAAVGRAINLSLQVNERFGGGYDLDVQTRTLRLVDDLLPVEDAGEPATRERSNSAVTVRLLKRRPTD